MTTRYVKGLKAEYPSKRLGVAESGLAAFGRYDPKADFRAPNSPVGYREHCRSSVMRTATRLMPCHFHDKSQRLPLVRCVYFGCCKETLMLIPTDMQGIKAAIL